MRASAPCLHVAVEVALEDEVLPPNEPAVTNFSALPEDARAVHIVGAGPAGLYAALSLIQHGLRPVIIERGQPVRQRRRDLVSITREHRVDPDSNYCFGEGGAGTYSDGKLYTRSHKRGDIRGALEWLVQFGADPSILVDATRTSGRISCPKSSSACGRRLWPQGGRCISEAG